MGIVREEGEQERERKGNRKGRGRGTGRGLDIKSTWLCIYTSLNADLFKTFSNICCILIYSIAF